MDGATMLIEDALKERAEGIRQLRGEWFPPDENLSELLDDAAGFIDKCRKQIDEIRAERNAAVKDLESLVEASMEGKDEPEPCDFCKLGGEALCPKPICVPEWRGPREEETEP